MAATPQSQNNPIVDPAADAAVASQSSIQCAEDYGVSSNPVLLANKLKAKGGATSDDGSLNNFDSKKSG